MHIYYILYNKITAISNLTTTQIGDPVRRAELERTPTETLNNLTPLVWPNEEVHIAEDMTLPAAEFMNSLEVGEAAHIAQEACRTFWCEAAPTNPPGIGRGSRGVPFVVYMRLALLVPRDSSRLVTHRRSGRSVFVTRGLGAPSEPIATIRDMETEVEALGGNILGLGRRRRSRGSGVVDWSADQRRLRYSDDYGTTATPEDYARFEFIFTAARFNRGDPESTSDYAAMAAELSRNIPRSPRSSEESSSRPDTEINDAQLPGQTDLYAALSNAREAPTYVEGGVELIASGGGNQAWDHAVFNRLAHHRLLRQHTQATRELLDNVGASSPISIDSGSLNSPPDGHFASNRQSTTNVESFNRGNTASSNNNLNNSRNPQVTTATGSPRLSSASRPPTTTPLSMITNSPLSTTPVYSPSSSAQRRSRHPPITDTPSTSSSTHSSANQSAPATSSQVTTSRVANTRRSNSSANSRYGQRYVGATRQQISSSSTDLARDVHSSTSSTTTATPATTTTSSTRRNSSRPLLSLRRSSARLSSASNPNVSGTTSSNSSRFSDSQRNSDVVISQFPAIPGADK